jgi:hypothetical protein
MHGRDIRVVVAATAGLALAACAGGGIDFGPNFGTPMAVSAVVPATVTAGQVVEVQCWLFDEEDRQVLAPEALPVEVELLPADAFTTNEEGAWVAVRAGAATARCAVPSFDLVQDEPSELHIVPGAPHRVATEIDRDRILAGESLAASCHVFDEWDNAIDDAPVRLAVDPRTAGTTTEALTATLRQAGAYTAVCQVPGATHLQGAAFTVLPDLPSTLLLAHEPERLRYGQQEMVQFEGRALDRFGNHVPAALVSYTSVVGTGLTQALSAGNGAYQMPLCGSPPCTVRIRAEITSPTHNGGPVSTAMDLKVEGDGPRIRCLGPGDASMIDWPPGGTRIFAGQVVNEAAWVRVNGNLVNVSADGRFETPIPVRFGINFVDVETEDYTGAINSRTCTFLLAGQWTSEHWYFNDSVSLALDQNAVDDGDRTDVDSLADALDRLLNSDALAEAFEDTLRRTSPLMDWRGCFLACVSARVHYVHNSFTFDGPHEVSLTLTPDGLRTRLVLRNIRMRLRLSGTCGGSIWVTLPTLIMDATLELRASAGLPQVTVRQIHEVRAPGFNVSAQLNGACVILQPILDLVDVFFNERKRLESFVRSFLQTGFSRMFGGLMSSFGVREIGASFDVPRFDGTGALPVQFAVWLSSLNAQGDRLLGGLGTQIFPATYTRARHSLGVPVPPGVVLHDPNLDPARSATVAIHVGILNQVLHTLWRGGFFDADLNAFTPANLQLPAGTEATLRTLLPPVASLREDGRLQLQLGAVQARAVVPGVPVIENGLELVFGMVASAPLTFDPSVPRVGIGAITADEISVSVPTLHDVPMEARVAAQDLLVKAAQLALDVAVNESLPAFPVPSITFGDALEPLDLSGTLGLFDPTLETAPPHYVFRSGFGLMP